MAELLNVQDLRVHFHIAAKGRNAVDGVSFSLEEGEILGLVGESGSGKSVTAMSISGLLPRRQAEVSGSIKLGGRESSNVRRKSCGRFRAMIWPWSFKSL